MANNDTISFYDLITAALKASDAAMYVIKHNHNVDTAEDALSASDKANEAATKIVINIGNKTIAAIKADTAIKAANKAIKAAGAAIKAADATKTAAIKAVEEAKKAEAEEADETKKNDLREKVKIKEYNERIAEIIYKNLQKAYGAAEAAVAAGIKADEAIKAVGAAPPTADAAPPIAVANATKSVVNTAAPADGTAKADAEEKVDEELENVGNSEVATKADGTAPDAEAEAEAKAKADAADTEEEAAKSVVNTVDSTEPTTTSIEYKDVGDYKIAKNSSLIPLFEKVEAVYNVKKKNNSKKQYMVLESEDIDQIKFKLNEIENYPDLIAGKSGGGRAKSHKQKAGKKYRRRTIKKTGGKRSQRRR